MEGKIDYKIVSIPFGRNISRLVLYESGWTNYIRIDLWNKSLPRLCVPMLFNYCLFYFFIIIFVLSELCEWLTSITEHKKIVKYLYLQSSQTDMYVLINLNWQLTIDNFWRSCRLVKQEFVPCNLLECVRNTIFWVSPHQLN